MKKIILLFVCAVLFSSTVLAEEITPSWFLPWALTFDMAISEDEDYLCYVDLDRCYIFDIKKDKFIDYFDLNFNRSSGNIFISGGNVYFSSSSYRYFNVYNIKERIYERNIKFPHIKNISYYALSPDHNTLAFCSDSLIFLFNIDNRETKKILPSDELFEEFPSINYWGITISPDKKTVAAVDMGNEMITIFDVEKGEVIKNLTGENTGARPYFVDNQRLIVWDREPYSFFPVIYYPKIIDIDKEEIVKEIHLGEVVNATSFRNHGGDIAILTFSRKLFIYDRDSFNLKHALYWGGIYLFPPYGFPGDRSILSLERKNELYAYDKGEIHRLNYDDDFRRDTLNFWANKGEVFFTEDSKNLYILKDTILCKINADNGSIISSGYFIEPNHFTEMNLSHNAEYLAAVKPHSLNPELLIYQTETKDLISSIPLEIGKDWESDSVKVFFSRNNKYISIVEPMGFKVLTFNIETKEMIDDFETLDKKPVTKVDFCNNGYLHFETLDTMRIIDDLGIRYGIRDVNVHTNTCFSSKLLIEEYRSPNKYGCSFYSQKLDDIIIDYDPVHDHRSVDLFTNCVIADDPVEDFRYIEDIKLKGSRLLYDRYLAIVDKEKIYVWDIYKNIKIYEANVEIKVPSYQCFSIALSPNGKKLFLSLNYINFMFDVDIPIVTDVAETGKDNPEYLLHPNPASSYIRINYEGLPQAEGTIYSLEGIPLLEFRGTEQEIDISSLPTGTYILKLRSGTEVITEKFVVWR